MRNKSTNETKRRRGDSEEDEGATDEESVLSTGANSPEEISDTPIWQTIEKKQVLVNPTSSNSKPNKKRKKNKKETSNPSKQRTTRNQNTNKTH